MVFQTESEVLAVRRLGHRGDGVGGGEPASRPVTPRWSRPAASSESAGPSSARPTAPTAPPLEVEWGERIDPDDVERALAAAGGEVKAVFTTHSETSTGVVNDVRALAEVAHRHGAVICVDAVSGLGVVDLPTDDWELDVVASGSQKALMTPAGPGLRCRLGARATRWRARRVRAAPAATTSTGRGRARASSKRPPDSPFTPAVTLVRALDVALEMIEQETLPGVFERHAVLAQRGARGRQGARARAVRPRGRERQRRHGGARAGRRRRRGDPED